MKRRKFVQLSTASLLTTAAAPFSTAISSKPAAPNLPTIDQDIVVIGSGVFGLWSAFYMQQLGARVTLVDAYGPGNPRGSSGGESRIIRSEYGEQFMYTRMNNKAHDLWLKWEKEWNKPFIYSTGRLTLGDAKYRDEALKVKKDLEGFGVKGEVLSHDELKYRWPQINVEDIETGLYFSGGAGGSTVMARESCHAVADAFVKGGGKLVIGNAKPGKSSSGNMEFVDIGSGKALKADKYIFACGPWMAKVFPELFAPRLKVYRREVYFVGSPSGDDRYAYPNFPVWLDGNMYGMPDLRGQGLKVAPFPDYNTIDPDTDERMVNPYITKKVHDYVNFRFPGLKNQPIVSTRVCQLTFSKDEHFIIDQHPDMKNVWFVCAGSGHGFKHGPALGDYVANRILNNKVEQEYDEAFRLK
ncbi:MAG: NAD(P)/FAD-dependent oxidoreductase [Cyclobacteriaceae bacterium]